MLVHVGSQEGIASTTWIYKTITSTHILSTNEVLFFVELSSCDQVHDDMDPKPCDPIPSMKPLFLNEGNPISGSISHVRVAGISYTNHPSTVDWRLGLVPPHSLHSTTLGYLYAFFCSRRICWRSANAQAGFLFNRSLGIFRHICQMMIGVLNHLLIKVSHTNHVWYIYLHLVDFYGKCS